MRALFAATLLFLSSTVWAQQPTDRARDRGVSIEAPDTRAATDARAPQQAEVPFCAGENTSSTYNNNVFMGGPIVGIAWTASASLTISRVEVFTGESTAPIGLAIWSDDGGSPSKPLSNLGDTGYFNLPSTVNSWQGADLITPVTVNAGTKYWIIFDPSGGEQAPVQNGVGQQYWGSSSGTITSVPAASWFGPFSFPDRAWKFRLFCLPAPKDVYAAKFVCGNFTPNPGAAAEEMWPVKPGNYLTAINVHNPNARVVAFRKKAVLLYRADAPPKEFELPMPPGKLYDASLRDDWGLEIDCSDIRRKLLTEANVPPTVFIKGWVIIEVTGSSKDPDPLPIDVTAVYTSHGWDLKNKTAIGFSQDVEAIQPKRIKK